MKRIIILLLLMVPIGYSITDEQVINQTLLEADIEMQDFGYTGNDIFLRYVQTATDSPAEIHTKSMIVLVVLADQYPSSDSVYAYAIVGDSPLFVTYAKTNDVNDYVNGDITSNEFSNVVYGVMLVPTNQSEFIVSSYGVGDVNDDTFDNDTFDNDIFDNDIFDNDIFDNDTFDNDLIDIENGCSNHSECLGTDFCVDGECTSLEDLIDEDEIDEFCSTIFILLGTGLSTILIGRF